MATVDRLVGFLAVYTRDRSLEDLTSSLSIQVVRSAMGAREIAFEFAAESSDRMDRIADTARLVGGYTFTGTSRHFVQYRDAAAPFGYDATEAVSTDAALALYHERFDQTYVVEHPIDLRALLLRLMPRLDPAAEPGPMVVATEDGLGPALVQYLVRSHVAGETCIAEWPPESAFDNAPVRRWIFRVPDLPERMRPLLRSTPGIACFAPVGPGVAVEIGYRHPIELRACPLFDPAGLVLLRGRGDDAWVIERLPPMGELTTFSHVELRPQERVLVAAGNTPAPQPTVVRVALRIVPSSRPWRSVSASWITPEQIPLLRRLAYALPHATVAQTQIALTPRGALLRSSAGIEGIPLGTFYVEVHPRIYVPAGHEFVPAVAPEVLAAALDLGPSQTVFLPPDARAVVVDEGAFAPLEVSLLEAPPWDELAGEAIERSLEERPIELNVTSIGLMPLRGVEPPTQA